MDDSPEDEKPRSDGPSIQVECYAGHRADTEPRCLRIGHREIAVTEILDRWLDPTHRYFKLRGNDGGIYLLRHDTASDLWELTLFDSGVDDDRRLSST
jgi:hypothetical protein